MCRCQAKGEKGGGVNQKAITAFQSASHQIANRPLVLLHNKKKKKVTWFTFVTLLCVRFPSLNKSEVHVEKKPAHLGTAQYDGTYICWKNTNARSLQREIQTVWISSSHSRAIAAVAHTEAYFGYDRKAGKRLEVMRN